MSQDHERNSDFDLAQKLHYRLRLSNPDLVFQTMQAVVSPHTRPMGTHQKLQKMLDALDPSTDNIDVEERPIKVPVVVEKEVPALALADAGDVRGLSDILAGVSVREFASIERSAAKESARIADRTQDGLAYKERLSHLVKLELPRFLFERHPIMTAPLQAAIYDAPEFLINGREVAQSLSAVIDDYAAIGAMVGYGSSFSLAIETEANKRNQPDNGISPPQFS